MLRTGEVLVDVSPLRGRLLTVRRGDLPWESVTAWADDLLADLAAASAATTLPESPDRAAIDALLYSVRERGLS
nr:hypothetical protein GCM10020092_057690 [Actinoplanes digitatis]